MIERLHSNAAQSRLVATKSSVPLSNPRPSVTLSQWSKPCDVGPEFDAGCRLNDHVNNDVELRWKCTKPRSGLDKAGSTRSNISSYGTVASVQVRNCCGEMAMDQFTIFASEAVLCAYVSHPHGLTVDIMPLCRRAQHAANLFYLALYLEDRGPYNICAQCNIDCL